MALRFDAEQRFTCRSCARCCTRWEIVVAADEVERYRKAQAERWFRGTAEAAEGTGDDPFEPVRGGAWRIRRRPDGACGFLSRENRCRIHEELGEERKPLTCRLFPFRFHASDAPPVLALSFSCPTVAANEGAPVTSQLRALTDLRKEWTRVHREEPAEIVLVRGRSLRHGALGTLREVLRAMLDRPSPEGPPDLRANVARMAATLEDLTRRRVLQLEDERFAEYLDLTGRYAAKTDKPVPRRPPSRVARLLFKGLLLAVVAARLRSQSTGGRRLRLLRVLLHLHGLGPPAEGIDRRARRRAGDPLADPEVRARAHHYLRAAIETLGRGPRPVLEELSVAVALLNAAEALAAMRAVAEGRPAASVADFTAALNEAADLGHTAGLAGRFVATFAAGIEAFRTVADPPV